MRTASWKGGWPTIWLSRLSGCQCLNTQFQHRRLEAAARGGLPSASTFARYAACKVRADADRGNGDIVALPLRDGSSLHLHKFFLRENLKSSIDSSSFQRLTHNVPENFTTHTVTPLDDDTFLVEFSDGTVGHFVLPPAARKGTEAISDSCDLLAVPRQLWGAEGMPPAKLQALLGNPSVSGGLDFPFNSLGIDRADRIDETERASEQVGQGRAKVPLDVVSVRMQLLEAVRRYGIVVVSGAPTQADVGKMIADALVGAVETTNFGYKFVIKKVEDPHNLAFDSIPLQQHTDFTYIKKPPDVALFHCIQNAECGGDSLWLDGFSAADHLRRVDPDAFEILTNVQVLHMDITDKWDLQATHPTIEVDERTGNLSRVYFNERTRDSWRQWHPNEEGVTSTSAEFYRALRKYEQLVERRDWYVNTPLKPGDVAIFDNERIMHSRTAFQGNRHMEGFYMSWETMSATWRALRMLRQGQLHGYCGNIVGKTSSQTEK